MKRFIIFSMAVMITLMITGCKRKKTTGLHNDGNNKSTQQITDSSNQKKLLVVYFSATGTTKKIAEQIVEVTNADEFEIEPAKVYTSEDLNYGNDNCRANLEQKDKETRPLILNKLDNMDQYDIIFIGYPIWWGEEPRIIDTFIEDYDLSKKTVIPFCTSGGSDISTSENHLKKLGASSVQWIKGKRFESHANIGTIQDWIENLELQH